MIPVGLVLTMAWLVVAVAVGGRLAPVRRFGSSAARRVHAAHGSRTSPAQLDAAQWAQLDAAQWAQLDAAQWADLLSAVAADTRTGTSLTRALHHLPLPPPGPIRGFWRDQVAPEPSINRDLAVVLHAITTAQTLGGPPAATLDGAAAVLRERAAARADASVHSAQARLSARVLTGVPLAFALWSAGTSASFRAALASPIGISTSTLGVLLNVVGWRSMRRSIRRAAP